MYTCIWHRVYQTDKSVTSVTIVSVTIVSVTNSRRFLANMTAQLSGKHDGKNLQVRRKRILYVD
jgi:hypothetical protein